MIRGESLCAVIGMNGTNGLNEYQVAIANTKRLVQISNDLLRHSQCKMALADLVRMISAHSSRTQDWPTRLEANQKNGKRNVLVPILDLAIEITEADFGNIQLFDHSEQALRIAVSRGLETEFLDYFAVVQTAESACAVVMQQKRRVIVSDVTKDPLYSAKSRAIMLRAKVLACQSTPMVSSSGRLFGVLSTHYRVPRKPPPLSLPYLDLLARRSATLLE